MILQAAFILLIVLNLCCSQKQHEQNGTLKEIKAYVLETNGPAYKLATLDSPQLIYITSELPSDMKIDSLLVRFWGQVLPTKGARIQAIPIKVVRIERLE